MALDIGMLIAAVVFAVAFAGISLYHYFTARGGLGKDLPTHYSISGKPDSSVASSHFYIYPTLVVIIAGSMVPLVALLPFYMNLGMLAVEITSLWLLIVTQYYAAEISKGKQERIPPKQYYLSLLSLLLATVLMIILTVVATNW